MESVLRGTDETLEIGDVLNSKLIMQKIFVKFQLGGFLNIVSNLFLDQKEHCEYNRDFHPTI